MSDRSPHLVPLLRRLLPGLCAAALLALPTASRAEALATTVIKPKPALDGLLRNPASGWVLYLETQGGEHFQDAAKYWEEADPYVPSASIFYIRCTWTQLEPTEGHFAWKEDSNFQALLEGAKQRHLKLGFRVMVNSKDCAAQAAPDWVREAGATGYLEEGAGKRQLWTPSVKDLVFRRKLEHFIAAFAQEFDDPSRVDYIDGCGLGWWGEMHHLDSKPEDNEEVLTWICGTYAQAFQHVLLGIQVNSPLGEWGRLDHIAIDQFGYVARMDSLGSSWLTPGGQQILAHLFPDTPFFGESCYYALDYAPSWKEDKRGLNTIRDVLQASYDDAITYHSNTLDLRSPHDASVWMREAPDLVTSFIAHGGYRLYPTTVEFPRRFAAGQPVRIAHTWENLGTGVMANDNARWSHKYHVAFALLDPATKKTVATEIDPDADPGTWVAGQDFASVCQATFTPAASAGHYLMATAIVNTQASNTPEIQLAIANLPQSNGWTILGPVDVTATGAATSSANAKTP